MLKTVLWVVGSIFGLFVAVVLFGMSRPDFKETSADRRTIEYCWEQQGRKSLDDYAKRLHAAECERMESDFQAKYGHKP